MSPRCWPPLETRADSQMIFRIISVVLVRFGAELHFKTGAQLLIDQCIAGGLADSDFLVPIISDLALKKEVQAPVQSWGKLFAEQQLHLEGVCGTVINLPFSLDRRVQGEPPPLGKGITQLQCVAVMTPAARLFAFSEILIVVFKVHLN